MARVGTGDGWDIGTWEQGENPGAGSQDMTVFTDTGLAGNFKRIWRGIKSLLNPDGTVQDDKIDGRHLKSTTVDNVTLEVSAATGPKTYRVKAGGLGSSHYGAASIPTAAMQTDSVDGTILKDDPTTDSNRAVNTNHIRDAAITGPKIAADAVTVDKEAHDNNSRKMPYTFTINNLNTTEYGYVGNVQTSATVLGIPMPRAGSITRIHAKQKGASAGNATSFSYIPSGTGHFAQGDCLSVYQQVTPVIYALLNGAEVGNRYVSGFASAGDFPVIVTVEVEFDD